MSVVTPAHLKACIFSPYIGPRDLGSVPTSAYSAEVVIEFRDRFFTLLSFFHLEIFAQPSPWERMNLRGRYWT